MPIGRREFLTSVGAMTGTAIFGAGSRAGLALTQEAQPLQAFSNSLKKVDDIFAAEFARDPAASVTVGIVQGAELVWTKSYGFADVETKRLAAENNLYRIGSITKQFTAIAFLQLVQKGTVHLTDPVEKYVPEFNAVAGKPSWSPPVTLLQLATHTSGLDRESGDVEVYTRGAVKEWEQTLFTALQHTKYLYEPGTRQSYSNIGYAVLGAAIGRASGKAYIEYTTENVLQPLGLKDTSFDLEPSLLPRLAHGYENSDGKADRTVPDRELATGRGYKVPNGALFTTVGDLSKFVAFELGYGPKSLIDPKLYNDNLTRIYASDTDLHGGYGLGFGLNRRGDLVLAGHGGSVAGYTAGAYFHRRAALGIIFLRNYSKGLGTSSLFDVAEVLVPADRLNPPLRS